MKNQNRPNNSFINASILNDFKNFAKDGYNMLKDNCDIDPKFYNCIESDSCGNIIKVDGHPVTRKANSNIFFLKD
tara:strand:- start:532 stop:756 length:225 start_codon:yes stop_codon:yes gene_type:complete